MNGHDTLDDREKRLTALRDQASGLVLVAKEQSRQVRAAFVLGIFVACIVGTVCAAGGVGVAVLLKVLAS